MAQNEKLYKTPFFSNSCGLELTDAIHETANEINQRLSVGNLRETYNEKETEIAGFELDQAIWRSIMARDAANVKWGNITVEEARENRKILLEDGENSGRLETFKTKVEEWKLQIEDDEHSAAQKPVNSVNRFGQEFKEIILENLGMMEKVVATITQPFKKRIDDFPYAGGPIENPKKSFWSDGRQKIAAALTGIFS